MKKYWIAFTTVIVLSFTVLSWFGVQIYQQAPPIPEKVVTAEGEIVFTKDDFQQGQNIWQAMGGMEIGSVWGHGSYVAPDWTADWLHREIIFVLDKWATEEYGSKFDNLSEKEKSILQTRAESIFRTNSYDKNSGIITIDPVRAEAIAELTKYYSKLFTEGKEEYAIQKHAQPDPEKLKKLCAFFFWSSWAASTNRPGDDATYTNNWPHEKLIS
ncbi:MAG: nitric-oxide reductase large subunit, partial [Melioribacteraceae bacterium]